MKTIELDKSYDAKAVEERTYRFWMENHHFRARPNPDKQPYTIVIPPPNITGSLHMGHALDNTIQDVLIRYHRMLGREACWVPGTDHAGIATQNVVEKQLKKEGKTRHDVGREKFIEKVWEWKEQYGNTIVEQLKRLGVSCDWDRLAFTMDEPRCKAVREVFVRLFEKGDIYRGKRLINWCPHCLTALSDLEVEHEESSGGLYHLRYPLVGEEGEVVIATTRPETILADVAVAVNPADERLAHLMGKQCTIPVANRSIPIIADEAVLVDFGTGALKITPAHDPTDFEIGVRHNLPQLVCLDEEGRLNEMGGKYQGVDRFKVRQAIAQELEETGFLVKKEEHLNKVGHCYRCHSVIEPYLSDQWFMNMKRLAEPAVKAVHDGSIRFVPERYSKTYLAWMENIRDWCISRQIWWGHRIPVWTCEQCQHRQGHLEDPRNCPQCQSDRYLQDPDVLDTWFSSGLWPFSVFGWPDKNPDLEYFYPTSTLVTGRDIINLWVARMIMLGYEFLGDKPYQDVHIHATIMTRDGQRMSKSKGTGIDPLELIEKYGADGTRFGLMSQATQSQDVRHTEERYEQGRNFCNKIWNAVRLSLMLIPDGTLPSEQPQPTSLADRWLLTRASQLTRRVCQAIESYNFDDAARSLYEFFWNELCDWYLELIKPVFYHRQDAQEQGQVAQCLLFALDRYLRLSHPIMPLISEELWHHLPGERGPLIHARMPEPSWEDAEAVAQMELLQDVVRAARNLRAEMGLLPKQKAEVRLVAPADRLSLLQANHGLLEALALAEPLSFVQDRPAKALSQRVGEVEVFLPFPADFDLGREVTRLESELADARKLAEGTERKLANQAFIDKAKPEVVARERERLADYQERARRVEERLKLFTGSAS